MGVDPSGESQKVLAIRVRQWLDKWNEVTFAEELRRRKPEPHFYMFALPASQLKALSAIHRRTTEGGLLRSQDIGIQRRHDEARSETIGDFIQYGYPWTELRASVNRLATFHTWRHSERFDSLLIVP
jgi:hypothetical protein